MLKLSLCWQSEEFESSNPGYEGKFYNVRIVVIWRVKIYGGKSTNCDFVVKI